MKKFFISLLSTILLVAVAGVVRFGITELVDGAFEAGAVKKLAGTYMMEDPISAETAEKILTNHDFYPEEIACADLDSLFIPKYVEYHSDKTYTFYYDAEAYRSNVEAFLRNTFDSMYENRASITELYNVNLESMSKADFLAYYASLYSQNSFDDLVSVITNGCWDYEAVANDVEVGTYSVQDNKIIFTVQGSTLKEHVTYKLSGDSLTMTYSNDVETYTRCTK